MARYEKVIHKRERKIIKDLKEKEERRRVLNREAAARCRLNKENTIKGLEEDVKELKQTILEKDFEIRNLKMKLDSLQENMNQHQRWTPESMMVYQNEQTPVWVLNTPGVPFPFEQQQTGSMGQQEQVPVQPQFYVFDYPSPNFPPQFDNSSQPSFLHSGFIFSTPTPTGTRREPAYQPSDNRSPTTGINTTYIFGVSPPGQRKEPTVAVQNNQASTAPQAPEAPTYQELTVQQTPEETETYDRPNDLPPTVPRTHPTIQKPIVIFSPASIHIRNMLMGTINAERTPVELKRILENFGKRDSS